MNNKIFKFLFGIALTCFTINNAFASDDISSLGGLRALFSNNEAFIYTINMRTFGANDYNKDGIIQKELGEVSGTFINAIPRLKMIQKTGSNTVYLLPITKTGKLKALGTAGSLYAMDSFDTIAPELFDINDVSKNVNEQAKKFVSAAHKLGLNVIVDLPSCGSYDMSLEKPELFVKNKNGQTVIPADWTDVRLFRVYDNASNLNQALVNEHKKFVDLMIELDVDGIRADVAAIKPYEFWKEIISYTRDKKPNFLFLAEASPSWTNPAKDYAPYATVDELLSAGFDGFYADWSDLRNIKTASNFEKNINDIQKILSKYGNTKSVIANFATHDQVAPSVIGAKYWQMVNWLNMTLPINPYTLDGFQNGDSFKYSFENSPAKTSYTDDDSYFVHSGKMDIFNFSRAPFSSGESPAHKEYMSARMFREYASGLVSDSNINFLKTNSPSVFAFQKKSGNTSVVVVGNLDYYANNSAFVKIPKFKETSFVMPFKMQNAPKAKKGGFNVNLTPFEVQVFYIQDDIL